MILHVHSAEGTVVLNTTAGGDGSACAAAWSIGVSATERILWAGRTDPVRPGYGLGSSATADRVAAGGTARSSTTFHAS